ncbi:interferon-induced protein 44-like [Saccostrea echinata]|uniref:interferon-induced protein 44-like n=1 Tax=Saccostrea echinata TaxID=191078 RepID=UPI002A7F8120|nr:interferon-induced protein 44-like [Saccostrea echinata]
MAVQRIGICINICLFGVCNSGKSSFINTCATALQDGERQVELATVGSSSESLTTRLREYKISSKDNKHLISMYDCRGMDDTRGVTTKDLISIVKGHIRSNYEINSEKAISEESDFYRQVPQIEDIMHCVVFVIDAEVPNEKLLSDHCLEQFKEVETVLEAEDIPVLAIVCKTDTLPIGEKNRLQDIFHSKSVEIKCRAVAEKLQIPLKNVLPMSNYFKEPLPTDEKDVLALNCLKEMTLRAADRLKQVYRYNNL